MRWTTQHLLSQSAPRRRAGFSYLEIQVAFVLFALGIGGLGPLVVTQSRQLRQLENRFADDTDYYVVPSDNAWARKLGAIAAVGTTPPDSVPPEPVFLIDNGAPGFNLIDYGTYDWIEKWEATARNGMQQRNNGGGIGDAAAWNFVGLQPGPYKVFVTYAERPDHATNAPFSVYDDNQLLGSVAVDQTVAPSGPVVEGSAWEYLGLFVIDSDVLRVVVSDLANGNIAADAVRIVPHRNTVQVNAVIKSMGSEAVAAAVSVTGPPP